MIDMVATRAQRVLLTVIAALGLAVPALADTARVTSPSALVWNQPSAYGVVLAQLPRGTVVDVVKRAGAWYQIVLPVRATAGAADRSGFMRASQLAIATTGAPSARATRLLPQKPSTRNPIVVLIDGGYRIGSEDLTRTSTAFAADYAENGSIATNYGKASGGQFGATVIPFLLGPLGVGFGVDYSSHSGSATVDAEIPHPFFFNQDRSASFATSALSGHQIAINIPIVWTLPSYGALKILVFGGPTFFLVKQDVVTDLDFTDTYPFDTVTISDAITEERSGSALGFHVGGDVSYFFTPTLGVGGGARYSKGTLSFDNDDNAATSGSLGGFQVAGGLRLRF